MIINKSIYERLQEVAREEQTIFYGRIAELAGLDIHSQEDRQMIGRLLDDIDRFEYAHGRPMLSVVVVRERTGYPGPGFFELARRLGLHKGKSDTEFFQKELHRVHSFWPTCPLPEPETAAKDAH